MALRPNGQTTGLARDRQSQELAAQAIRARVLEPAARRETGLMHPQASLVQPAPLRQLGAPRPGLIDAFVKTCQRWRLNRSEQIVLLGYAGNEYLGAEILSGRYVSAPQDVKDRASYLLGISVGLGMIFNEAIEAELDWLNSPKPELGNRAPLPFMLLGRMSNIMKVAALVEKERGIC